MKRREQLRFYGENPLSDRPRVIHACKTTIDQDNGFSIEFRDWWPIKIHEASTSYTRTDLVDEKDKRITELENTNRLLCRDLDEAQRAIEVLRGEGE